MVEECKITEQFDPISDMEYLESILEKGYTLEGPRKEPESDKKAIERFFKKGHVFYPQSCLLSDGCQLVPPSALTKGLEFAYKCEGEDMSRYHKSKYALIKDDVRIPLYLESPEH